MFKVKPHKALKDLHRIVNNFSALLNDGENDILYTGTNSWGNRLLGSIVFEDDEEGFLRYYHVMITDKQFSDFLNRRVSLREILHSSENFFAVDKNYKNEEIDYNLVFINDIDEKYLPRENSYCPDFIKDASLEYSFSLKGDLSDVHKVEPQVMSEMNSKFCSFLRTSSQFLGELHMKPHIYSEPAMTGSFKLNFRIDFLNNKLDVFDAPKIDLCRFYFNFFNYVFEKLPAEPTNVFKQGGIDSRSFLDLVKDLGHIQRVRGVTIPDEGVQQRVINLITYSVDNFKNINYEGFDRIEVLNTLVTGEELQVGLIEKDYYNTVQEKIFKPEDLIKKPVVSEDEIPTEYNIQVFSLNTRTGVGSGYYNNNNGGIVNISVYLHGRKDYQNTIFTKSMHEAVPIQVKGIGKRINGVLKILNYTFDE